MKDIVVPVPERFLSDAYLNVLESSPSQLLCDFDDEAMVQMKAMAVTGYPDEICGLLVGTSSALGWHVQSVHQVTNINEERAADRFQLDPAGYQAVDKSLRGSGQEIIGVFHSHPDCPAQPSPTDLQSAWEGFIYPIISVCQGQVAEVNGWVLSNDVAEGGRFQALRLQP
ncbi:MAG: hypothetical protein AUK35_08695 [Zetaproteobacteria bacterium CG2_30_46_52]|nr:MAG: hypothetical protein AUK35_08695 [Zetaproteobacteria bacterium CG2_30_46_52]